MSSTPYQTALIVGAGSGLSAALARVFAKEGMAVALAARTPADLGDLAKGDRCQDLRVRRDAARRRRQAVRRCR